jgi:hypothetical protein
MPAIDRADAATLIREDRGPKRPPKKPVKTGGKR